MKNISSLLHNISCTIYFIFIQFRPECEKMDYRISIVNSSCFFSCNRVFLTISNLRINVATCWWFAKIKVLETRRLWQRLESFLSRQKIFQKLPFFSQRSWVFVTNFDFIIPIFANFNPMSYLRSYSKLWFLLV